MYVPYFTDSELHWGMNGTPIQVAVNGTDHIITNSSVW